MSNHFNTFIKNERQSELFQIADELADKIKVRVDEGDKTGTFSKENVRDIKESGYLTLSLPEEFGGRNLSLYEFLLLQERLAVADGSVSLSIGWHLGVMMELSEKSLWSEEHFNFLAKEVGFHRKIVNRAASERATGSPARGGIPETRAVREGDHYKITGRKTFTTMGDVLDYFIVTAYIEDLDTVGAFLIEKEMQGLRIEHTWDTLGMRGTGSDDLILDGVKVPTDRLVETKGERPTDPKGWLLHIPACYLGIAMAARNDAIEFAKNYQPNSLNTPIAEVPHVQLKIGEIEMKLIHARTFMYAVAEKWDCSSHEERTKLSSELAVVKTVATNVANEVVDLAMRIVGGRGLSKQLPFERYYRDVRAGLHNPPMDDMVIQMLAKQALK